ncbi:scarecrow-like transcription factor 11 (SCL11) [Wolffia australiana]
MAKRELSSTLKNLKFMQRSVPKEEKPPEDETELKVEDGFKSVASVSGKCIVITEGNPHPSESKGRMSFQCFNPAVDRMYQTSSALPSQNGTSSTRENGIADPSGDMILGSPGKIESRSLKRGQADVDLGDCPAQQLRKGQRREGSAQATSVNNQKASRKQQKKEKKIDWNVLRPPKPQTKRC